MRTRKKKFDCVELQHRGGLAIYEATKGMTREEELAYWARRTAELRLEQEKLKRRRAGSRAKPG
ncbi:MAG: hypothetical protein FJX75_08955 [Armatimonadetes bacterium]|nr:hypothetical protein [Armatimonadota bacterium]